MTRPVAEDQTRSVLSMLPVASKGKGSSPPACDRPAGRAPPPPAEPALPSSEDVDGPGPMSPAHTLPSWPMSSNSSLPDAASHSRAFLSPL